MPGAPRHIWGNTFLTKNADFFPNRDPPKPLLPVGGGRLSDLHRPLYEGYRERLGGPINTPLPGCNVRYGGKTDFARLLLAWGLAQEEPELPHLRLPPQVEAEVPRERNWQGR